MESVYERNEACSAQLTQSERQKKKRVSTEIGLIEKTLI